MLHNPGLAREPHAAFPVEIELAEIRQPVWRRRGLRKVVFWVVGIVLSLAIILAAALAFLISQSVEVPFLRNQVDAAIERALGDRYAASVASATLDIDPVLGLVVRLRDISIFDSLDQEVARIPTTMLAISPVALLTPRDVVRSVEIDNAWFSIRRDGGLAILGNGDTPPAVEPVPGADDGAAIPGDGVFPPGFGLLSDPIEALDHSLAEILGLAASGFQRIDIHGATVELWRNGDPTPHRFERADVRIAADPDSGRLTATMTASGYSGRWSLSAERTLNPATGGRTLSLVFSQLTLADFFPAVGGDPSIIATDIPIYGRVIVGITSDGRVESANARLDLGAGYFAFGPRAKPITLEEATIHLLWDVPTDTILVQPSRFSFDPGGATMAGTIHPDGTGRFAFNLESADAILAPSDSPAPPLVVDRIGLTGTVDLNAGLLTFDSAAISSAYGSLQAAGSIGLEVGGPSIALVATLSEMPISVFKQLWPPGLEDGGRRWMLNSITSGTISGTLAAEIPAGLLASGGEITHEMLDLQITLTDMTFKTFEGFPNVTSAGGRAVLSGSTFGVDLVGGTIVAPSGEILEVTAATFVIGETAAAVPTAHVEVYVIGPISAFGSIANEEPIFALRQFGIPPSAIEGSGAAIISATWPLVDGMTIDEVQWRIALTLSELSSDIALDGMLIEEGELLLEITPSVVRVTGEALIDGVLANLDLAFPLIPEIDGRQQLRMVLDEEARRKLGFNLEGFLGGTVMALVSDLGADGPGQHYELDLEQARVILAPLGWAKRVGVPASMSFDLLETENGQLIRNLQLEGDGFGFVGEVELDQNFSIVRAEIGEFRLRRADSMSFSYERHGNGWAINAEGEAFDIRGLLAGGLGQIDATGGATDLTINGSFGTVIGFNGERIDDAEITFVSVAGRIERIDISGTLQGAPVKAVYEDRGEGAVLSVFVGDAGALLRFANVYDRAQGGQLIITGREASDGFLYGQVELTDFSVIDEPALTRLMTPVEGTPAELATTVRFETLVFEFIERGTMVTIQDVLLRGGDMGAVGAGWVDFGTGEISIAGTYIPAYTFNNMFARIPILGLALGGGNREGLFGITFQVAGPMDNVQIAINPLSAIAPGIFRKLFQFQ